MKCRLLIFLLLGVVTPGVLVAQAIEKYNIISIVTDDQGRWGVGAYGNKEVRTPNMDRLAREGALFLNAFTATPVCSPSRASFLTGLYGTQVGIMDWIAPLESDRGLGLPPETITWPEVLQSNGYVTALLGKWHLGTQPQFHPHKHGFNHFFGFLGGGNRPMDPTLELNGQTKELKGSLPDLLMDDALRFVESNRSRSFALLVHFRAPHLPYGPVPEVDSAPFRDLDPVIPNVPGLDAAQVKKWTRDYYASIHSVDRNIGRLLAKLDELDLTRKTIVLFTSDHGYMIGHHRLHTKGNAHWVPGGVQGPKRPNMFDDSIRVPFIVRWPGVVKPGTQIPEPVSNIDTFASVLGMLGLPLSATVRQQGMDFSPLLRGQRIPQRDAIFGQYDLHNGGLAFMRMIRTEQWKLVRHHFSNMLDELYDLKADPGETRSLYEDPAYVEIRNQLQQRLTQWQKSIDDPILAKLATLEPRPSIRNVLFIMGDDHSAEVLGCYGNSMVRTPNLDRLASEGVRFDRAYTNSPVCAPSRQSILTGKLPHAAGVTLLKTPLAAAQITIAEHLGQFGFRTGAIGKMHFNSDLPHGFDFRVDRPDHKKHLEKNPPRKPDLSTRVKPPWRPFRDHARVWLNSEALSVGLYDADSEGTYFAQRAIEFLRANKENRFCLWLSFHEPHSPFDFPIEYSGKYQPEQMSLPRVSPEDSRWIPVVFQDLTDAEKQGIVAAYYTSVEYLDKNVGLVLDELQQSGLDENTLVIYIGDHGYLLGHHGRFEKHSMWEPAVRAPLIMRNVPSFGNGKRIDALVEFVDLAPTILEVLGVSPMEGMQGKSLLPVLQGKTNKHRDHVFSEYLEDNLAMLRTERWKYVFTSGKKDLALGYATGQGAPGMTHRLYDLKNDPGELRSVSHETKYAKVLRELKLAMLERFKSTHPLSDKLPSGLSVDDALAWFCEPRDGP